MDNQRQRVSQAIPSVVAGQVAVTTTTTTSSTQLAVDSRNPLSTDVESGNTDHREMTPEKYLKYANPKLQRLANHSGSEKSGDDDDDDDDEEEEDPQSQTAVVSFEELRTGLAYDPRMRFHIELVDDDKSLDFHPEDPRRIIAIYKLLCENGLVEGSPYPSAMGEVLKPLKRIPARYATKDECLRVHEEQHFDNLQATASKFLDPDGEIGSTLTDICPIFAFLAMDAQMLINMSVTGESVYYNHSTYTAALLAAGTAIDTTLAVVKGQIKNAIAVIRPPGHHAESYRSRGFCHFNNIALAVQSARTECPSVKKVLIIDWDIHHGNGLQDAFEEDPNVLLISLHIFGGDFYPGGTAGAIAFDGIGPGKGKNINIGWECNGRTDGDYMMAFHHIIMPVANEFNPDLVMVASGFDAAEGDELGQCHVTPAGYSQMTHMLMSLANGKMIVCLEGGYNLRSISVSALAVTKTLMGQPPTRIVDTAPTESGFRTISDVIRQHNQYWQSLLPRTDLEVAGDIAEATRLHDVVRYVQADQLFKDYRMFPLPVPRVLMVGDTVKMPSKSFDNQILATPHFRQANRLLVIFHDQPQLAGAADPITGIIPLAAAKVIESVRPFITWAIQNGVAVMDVNLPDLYTSTKQTLSKETPIYATEETKFVSQYVWDTYVRSASAKHVVMLGVGNAFWVIQRIIAGHPQEEFERRSVRVVGVVEGTMPRTYKTPLFLGFHRYYPLWTKVWLPKTHRVLRRKAEGRPSESYGQLKASQHLTLNQMLLKEEEHILEAIEVGFKASPIGYQIPNNNQDDAGTGDGGDDDGDGNDQGGGGARKGKAARLAVAKAATGAGSDTSAKSVLGKRTREATADTDGDKEGTKKKPSRSTRAATADIEGVDDGGDKEKASRSTRAKKDKK